MIIIIVIIIIITSLTFKTFQNKFSLVLGNPYFKSAIEMCFKFRKNTVGVWSLWNLFHSARLDIVTYYIVLRKKATAVELFLRLWIEICVVSRLSILKSSHQYHSDPTAIKYFPLIVIGMTLCCNKYSIAQRLSFYIIIFLATLFCTLFMFYRIS